MPKKERVRFAPSPTGRLHIGNARTALFNFLFARGSGGDFILRIEDTDVERSAREHEVSLIASLRWLNLDWDEGPDLRGPFGPYRQSERIPLYKEYAEQLLREGKAFRCYCTEEELEARRKAMLRDRKPPKYSGKCRDLSLAQRRELEREGRVPCIRYRMPDRGEIRFDDLIHGAMSFQASELGDFVLVRSTGMPSYLFAVVVDDHHMEITTVIRGDDHLANTPRQVLLYRELGWEPPRFAHHGLLLGQDRSKLSKRHGVTSVEAFREMGLLPEALQNYLGLLGGAVGGDEEILTLQELIQGFSLEKTGRSAAVFDLQKLLWLGRQHLWRQSPARLLHEMAPYLEKAGYDLSGRDPRWLEDVAAVSSENIGTLAEAVRYAPIFFDALVVYPDAVREELTPPERRRALQTLRDRLAAHPAKDLTALKKVLGEVRKELGTGGKELFLPLRLAVTGMENGPELQNILPLLSPETILSRLEAALRV